MRTNSAPQTTTATSRKVPHKHPTLAPTHMMENTLGANICPVPSWAYRCSILNTHKTNTRRLALVSVPLLTATNTQHGAKSAQDRTKRQTDALTLVPFRSPPGVAVRPRKGDAILWYNMTPLVSIHQLAALILGLLMRSYPEQVQHEGCLSGCRHGKQRDARPSCRKVTSNLPLLVVLWGDSERDCFCLMVCKCPLYSLTDPN